jgi:hypothetical protein
MRRSSPITEGRGKDRLEKVLTVRGGKGETGPSGGGVRTDMLGTVLTVLWYANVAQLARLRRVGQQRLCTMPDDTLDPFSAHFRVRHLIKPLPKFVAVSFEVASTIE